MTSEKTIPQEFLWRRLHSLIGLWLVVYLTIHLFTNSQAALFIGDDGIGFVHAVNSIHELPYLPVIELLLLAFPILIHAIWGILYVRNAKYNSFNNTGRTPYLPEYPRNRAYTWQRITSYLLILGIIAHIIHMRVIEYPITAKLGSQNVYIVRITSDEGLYPLAARLGATIYDKNQIESMKEKVGKQEDGNVSDSKITPEILVERQSMSQQRNRVLALEKRALGDHEVIAEANSFGIVELLMLRDTFKMPLMLVLYTLFVLFACFHAFNGLWTCMITWGVTLTARSQRLMRLFSNALMVIVASFGLVAIWFTYWINLK